MVGKEMDYIVKIVHTKWTSCSYGFPHELYQMEKAMATTLQKAEETLLDLL
jgi:hypothetical protein